MDSTFVTTLHTRSDLGVYLVIYAKPLQATDSVLVKGNGSRVSGDCSFALYDNVSDSHLAQVSREHRADRPASTNCHIEGLYLLGASHLCEGRYFKKGQNSLPKKTEGK